MSCINTNSKEFKSLLDKVDISSATLELIIHKIQNTKNNAKYPSVSEINKILRPQSFEGSETMIEIWNKQYSSPINFPTIALAREEFNKASRIFGKNSVSIIEKKNGTYDLVVGNPSPNKIKSATENIGTFSRTNDDIYDTISKLISEKDASVNQTSPEVVTPAETKEVEVKEVTVADNNEPTVDLNTGLNIGKVRDRRKKKPGAKINPKPTRLIPSRLTWGVWEGFTNEDNEPIDVEMTLKDLSKFYTEEQWNQLSDEEMEHELKCKGSFIAK